MTLLLVLLVLFQEGKTGTDSTDTWGRTRTEQEVSATPKSTALTLRFIPGVRQFPLPSRQHSPRGHQQEEESPLLVQESVPRRQRGLFPHWKTGCLRGLRSGLPRALHAPAPSVYLTGRGRHFPRAVCVHTMTLEGNSHLTCLIMTSSLTAF